jgi:hypothetical protein
MLKVLSSFFFFVEVLLVAQRILRVNFLITTEQ